MRVRIAMTLVTALAMVAVASAAPNSMLHTLPDNQQVEQAPPSNGGLGWLNKWFSKPGDEIAATPGKPQLPVVAYDPSAAVAYAQPLKQLAPPSAALATNQPMPAQRMSSQVAALPAQQQPEMTEAAHCVQCKQIRALGHNEDRVGNLQVAEGYYRQAMQVDPASAAAVNDLGLCLARQGKLDSAAATFNQAIAMRPDKALYRNNIATVLVEMGREDEALAHLKSSYPAAVAMHNLGQLLVRANQLDAAAIRLREALEIDPNLGPAHEALARITPATPMMPSVEAVAPASPSVANESYVYQPSSSYAPRVAAAPTATPQTATAPMATPAPSVANRPFEDQSSAIVPSFPRLLPPVLDR